MSYATLMVRLELGRTNAGVLNAAGVLAERFRSAVIGTTACQAFQIPYGEPYCAGEVIEQLHEQTQKEIRDAEAEFRAVLGPGVKDIAWRSSETFEPLCEYFAREARAADLIVTAMDNTSLFDGTHHFNVSDLIMRAGRPVVLVPPALERVKFGRVLVGWKDSREARRAIRDALPLLQAAGHVVVVEIAPADRLAQAREHLADVATWLRRHGIEAETIASATEGSDVGSLARIAADQAADIIVAGAYGHSRLREWVFGGVTYDLLIGAPRFAFLSH
jgi:nucleotide-binding universal stress UspA family protein